MHDDKAPYIPKWFFALPPALLLGIPALNAAWPHIVAYLTR